MRRTLLLMWFTFSKLAVHAFIHSSHHCHRLFLIHQTTNQFPRRVAALDVSNSNGAIHKMVEIWQICEINLKSGKVGQIPLPTAREQLSLVVALVQVMVLVLMLTLIAWLENQIIDQTLLKAYVWLRTYVDQAKVLDLLETMSHGPIHAYHVYQKPY